MAPHVIAWIVVLMLAGAQPLWAASPPARTPPTGRAATGEGEAEGAGAGILYRVILDDTVERGSIAGRAKKNITFKVSNFSAKVKKYDVFLVLNTELTGVLAEIAVVKLTKKKTIAQAKLIRSSEKLNEKDLVHKTIIRLTDLKHVIGNSEIFRENPYVTLSAGRSSFVLSGANVATGAQLNPIVLSTLVAAELFAPKATGVEWLNWFGLRYERYRLSETSLTLRQAKTEATQKALITGEGQELELVFQPWFADFFIYHLAVMYGISSKSTDTIAFAGDALTPAATLSLSRTFHSLGVEVGLNPIPNIYTGVTARFSPGEEYELSTESSGGSKSVATGRWAELDITFWGQLVQPVSDDFRLQVRVNINRRSDSISESPAIGSGVDQEIVDWGSTLMVGLMYAP